MTSSDREILIAIQGEIHALRLEQSEQGQRLNRIESRITRLETTQEEQEQRLMRMEQRQESYLTEMRHTNDKIDWMQHTIYWGFAIIGIIIALFALRPQEHAPKPSENDSTLLQDVAELFKLMRRDKPE
ncbi:MAG: hypothetical protein IJQ58_09835 [Synergistaceae bacterium]|nr:hypothetical protein [Synergistaceae bacterium]